MRAIGNFHSFSVGTSPGKRFNLHVFGDFQVLLTTIGDMDDRLKLVLVALAALCGMPPGCQPRPLSMSITLRESCC